ncbi:hypothetical protein [Sansalvadorimonas verongulae]|uniref:hypothetical protein n=1 Tax=Sansalvadorimonas verongulae TaxID=2172824 RepID=UPI0012BBCA04|nr:hypothetical protein [Sansalvadorimonas verongulae]MTI11630.1 hypothetical protein [Sansalvadorimonas verongulae]
MTDSNEIESIRRDLDEVMQFIADNLKADQILARKMIALNRRISKAETDLVCEMLTKYQLERCEVANEQC